MSRLTWGAPTERFFETGVDRGVLYVGVLAGVSWNGLVSVSESPTGGDPKPAYIDGYKFRNVASSEEFEATLEAYAAPKEFAPCDGSVSIQNGLIATQQPRRAFSLSYRTKIGNAVDGADHAYKIHLVYNALAAPAERTNTTLTDSQGLNAISWSLTTLPPSLAGYKPTAHFVIDSRFTPRGLLAAVEDILYGTEAVAARMLLVSELVTMFTSPGPIIRTNLVINPSFRNATGTVEVRRNYVIDPLLITATGWVGVPAGGITTAVSVYSPNQAAAVGETWTVDLDIKAPAGSAAVGTLQVGATTGGSFGSNGKGTTNYNIPAGTTQRISNSYTLTTGADGLRLLLSSNVISLTITKVAIRKIPVALPYFDGSTAPNDGLTYSWTGTANASASIATGVGTYTNSFKGYLRPAWKVVAAATDGSDTSLSYIAASASTLLLFSTDAPPAVPGDVVSGRFRVRQRNGSANISITPMLYAYSSATVGISSIASASVVVIPSDGSWVDVVIPSGVCPANTVQARLYCVMTTSPNPYLGIIEVSNPLVEKASVVGAHFDGSTPDVEGNTYDWTGATDASTSTLKNWN